MFSHPKSNAAATLNRVGVYEEADSEGLVNQPTRILIADGESPLAGSLGDSLALEGYECESASNREDALDIVRKLECDIVICGVRMKGSSEFDLLDRIKVIAPNLPVIIGTEVGSIAEAVGALKRGAAQYLTKPFNIGELLDAILQAIAEAPKYRKTTRPPRVVAGLLSGELTHGSPLMDELVESIALVARSDAPVLILGESGTGKERVARAIHAGSRRVDQLFVAVNTSAIPEALLESEIFGHVRGAFTGATQARRGLLMEASGGTLLLDEIGDMPIMLQPKLLRVLQFGETRSVGSDRFGQVDVRVIAATHRDLNALVKDGRFREDLRYRLNVIPLFVPPLRSRREDIAPLVEQFLVQACERTPESPVKSISDEGMSVLREAAWPGNVRELENAIERLVVLGREPVVTAADLAFLQEVPPGESWSSVDGVPWTLKQMNQRYLDWVLARTGGDKVRAAGILNVDLSTLYRWARAKR
jgi:two-component system, NtrC family, response regulator HydG